MTVEQRVVELVIDASGVGRGINAAAGAYDHLGERAEAAMRKMHDMNLRQYGILETQGPRSIDAVARSYDNLKAKMDPVFHAQLRAEREMTRSLGIINQAVLLGVTTETEATRDIVRLKQQQVEAINRVRDAQLMADKVLVASNDNSARFRRQNAAYQYLDTATSLYGGMNPAMVFAQQGPQLAQVYAGAGGFKAALGDAASMAGTLVTRLLPVAAVAAVGAGALGTMRDNIEAASGESVTFGRVLSETVDVVKQDLSGLLKPVTDAFDFAFNYVGANLASAAIDIGEFLFKQFRAVYRDVAFLWENFPDMLEGAFIGALNKVASFIDKGIERVTGFINGLIERINGLPEWLGGGQAIRPIPGFKIGNIDNPAAARFDAANNAHKTRQQEELAGSPVWDYLKSVYERVLSRVETTLPLIGPVPGKDPRYALDADPITGDPALSAGRDRLRDLRQEVELFGLSGGAAAKARFEQEALNAAIAKHIELSPEQRAAISKDAAAYGDLTDQLSRLRIVQDAQFEIGQMLRSDRESSIAAQLRSYDMPVDLDSQNAALLRSIEIAKEYGETWREVGDIGRSAIDRITDGMADGFKNFDEMAKSILGDINKEFLKLAIANPLKNAIFGDTNATLGDIGGGKGFFSALTGGKMPLDPALRNVASMQVTAAAVVVNGGVSGFSPVDGVTRMQAAANGNDPFAAIMKGGGNPLGFVGNYKNGVDQRLTDILQKASLEFPDFKVDAMSGYRAGDPRFHGKGLATDVQLTDLVSGKLLGNYQDASSFATYERFAQTARGIQMRDYPELADKFRWGGYFGGGKGKYGALDTMHFDLGGAGMAGGSWSGGLNATQRALWPGIESSGKAAADALDGLATRTSFASDGLGSLGSGMGQFGDALSQIGAGKSSGGGLFDNLLGGLGSLLGGVSPTSSFWAPNTTYSNWLMGRPGFARGTNGAPEGWNWVGEDGPELMRMRGGEVIRPHAQSRDMAAHAGRQSVKREFNIINPPPGYQADVEEEEDDYGNEKVNVTFSKAISREMGRTGSPANKTLRSMGARRPRRRL